MTPAPPEGSSPAIDSAVLNPACGSLGCCPVSSVSSKKVVISEPLHLCHLSIIGDEPHARGRAGDRAQQRAGNAQRRKRADDLVEPVGGRGEHQLVVLAAGKGPYHWIQEGLGGED